MNLKPLLIAGCVAAAGSYAFADDAHHPDQPKASAEVPAKPAAKAPACMDGMHEHMKRMHEQMAAMRAATDPKERERLMEEHMQTMHEAMSMMPGMMKDAGK